MVSHLSAVVKFFIEFSKLERTCIIQKKIVNRIYKLHIGKDFPFIPYKATGEPRLQEYSRNKDLQTEELAFKGILCFKEKKIPRGKKDLSLKKKFSEQITRKYQIFTFICKMEINENFHKESNKAYLR